MKPKQQFNLASLLDTVSSNVASNNPSRDDPTGPAFGGLSITTLLENFVPGYGPIHNFVLHTFNFDVTILVSLLVMLYVLRRLSLAVYGVVYTFISKYYTSEITVSSIDDIHAHLVAFLAHKNETASSRRLMAETPSKTSWELDQEDMEHETLTDTDGSIIWLNFANQEAKTLPRYTPAMGSHNFWHKSTYFMLKRQQQIVVEQGSDSSTLRDTELITLACFGRSTVPIKSLIDDAKAQYFHGLNKKTVIKRPAGSDRRRFGGRGGWMKVSERPCRPLSTVVLDEAKKMEVLADINEYLSPATARWYANRGIPYRRGYLFYGPPGTGKSSLTFSLAGVFGLDIHVVSLLDPTLTEEELGNLFTSLPGRCIVLLEDIDTAGLVKRELPEVEPVRDVRRGNRRRGEVEGEVEREDQGLKVEDLAKALKKANQMSEEDKKKGITLSGLLNIIDGVASHEGRVLIMTTNKPEALDAALIRPGRVDHQVGFTNATQTQIKELFERMYTNDLIHRTPSPPAKSPASSTAKTTSHQISDGYPPEKNQIAVQTKSKREELTPAQLSEVAARFAADIPDGVFSPAEIQGFLLKRKTEPRKAAEEVTEWVKEMQEKKGSGAFN